MVWIASQYRYRAWSLVATLMGLMLAAMPPEVQAAEGDYVPVAKRPRSEILARGAQYIRPDLTRGTVNDYRDLLAWILNIRFTDAQADEFEQRMITRWPTLLKMDTDEITGASKLSAEIRAMPPAQLKATHKNLNEQVLKNLHDMVGGATMLGSFKVVTDDDRRQAQWLLAIYQDQHPESVAPMPQVPDVPGVGERPRPEPRPNADAPQDTGGKGSPTPAAPTASPAPQAADAMSKIICFLSSRAQGVDYVPPSQSFRLMLERKLAAEYPTYSREQQTALAQLPSYWTQLSSNWERMSASDRDHTLAQWKPLLNALQTASGPALNLPEEDRDAIATLADQAADTGRRVSLLRSLRQMDASQQLQLQQLERMQRMQDQQILMMSNIARSAHETNMRIIDNMGPTRHPWD